MSILTTDAHFFLNYFQKMLGYVVTFCTFAAYLEVQITSTIKIQIKMKTITTISISTSTTSSRNGGTTFCSFIGRNIDMYTGSGFRK